MLFTVNTEVCTRCGLCVADCPTGLLVMSENGPVTGKGGCISCGHCISVCPTLALDSDMTPRKEQIDISYIVVRDKQKLRRIADLVLEWMHLAAKTVPIMRLYARAAQAEVDKGKEYILRDAPALVVAIGSKKDIHRTHDSGHSCLSYAELYAPTLGLGTCWAGFFEHAGEAEYKPLLELLGVPEDKIIAGGILMGYPKVRYRNIVERQPLDVTFDTEE